MKLFAALLALAAFAQTAAPPPAPVPGAVIPMAPAAIPIELQAEYFRSDGVLAHLKAEMADAQTDFEAAVKAVVAACGADSAPTLTADRKHLFCVAKPPAPAAQTPTTKQ
jgi:hypothetical protein